MNNIKEAIHAYIILGVVITLVLIGFYVFSYILIMGALIGLLLYTVSFIRMRFFSRTSKLRSRPKKTSRTIDHNPNE